jgi:hypothetical protein
VLGYQGFPAETVVPYPFQSRLVLPCRVANRVATFDSRSMPTDLSDADKAAIRPVPRLRQPLRRNLVIAIVALAAVPSTASARRRWGGRGYGRMYRGGRYGGRTGGRGGIALLALALILGVVAMFGGIVWLIYRGR